jgi:biofilm PGA synthesis N-glycosyltransferase PgaC
MRLPANREPSGSSSVPFSRFALIGLLASALWTYVGYLALLAVVKSRKERPADGNLPLSADTLPSLTVIVAAFDEEVVIEAKIKDLRSQDYPSDKLQVIVAADGSKDATAQIAESLGVECIWRADRLGKTSAINRAVEIATGEIICLTDANCALEQGSLAAIAEHFLNPRVGIVSGAKMVSGEGGRGAGEGLYWRYEAMLKAHESELGVTMGAPGELLGIRSSLFRPIPAEIINDDFYLTCDVLDQGYESKYASEALTSEETPDSAREEFGRRTRIAAGTWQSSLAFSRLASPRRGWLAVSFISHRILRNMVVPLALPVIWLLSRRVGRSYPLSRLLYRGQWVAYVAAAVGIVTDARALAPFSEFLLVNAAQLRGGFRWLTGRQNPLWDKPVRKKWA